MRKIKLLLAASVLCTGLQSQPYTGLTTYQHSTAGPKLFLSDGSITGYNTNGFVLTGYMPFTSGGPRIYIDKTDVDGLFNSSLGEFSREYKFAADPTNPCGGAISAAGNCYGTTIKEVKNPAGPEWYVMAAAFDQGCIYSGLDMNGNVVCPAYYTFPPGAVNPSKPLITPSFANPGKFYICGSYMLSGVSIMYAMQIGYCGTLGWSRQYTLASGASEFVPAAIIESPYGSSTGGPDVKVVGTFDIGTASLRDGFMFTINGNNGAQGLFISFGTFMASSNERLLSINLAASTAAGPAGYIIGGSCDLNPSDGTSWMLKTDQFGNYEWSSIIMPSSGTTGEVVGVVERLNTYNQYEYYGTATENNGMTVFKLDDLGNIFSYGSLNNEFIYNDNIGGSATPVAITDNNMLNGINEGIHIYGTNTPGYAGDYFMTRACFNGAAGNTGCGAANIQLNVLPPSNVSTGPFFRLRPQIQTNQGLNPCPMFNFNSANTSVTVPAPCNEYILPTSPYGGDQSRTAAVTGIKLTPADNAAFNVSPNPVTDKLQINYASITGAEVSVGLYNNLGQLVKMVTPKNLQSNNTLELDLNALNINSGVYFVTLSMDGAKTTKKIIYTK